MRPFNALRFKYNWHWFWDTGNGDIGNQGVHEMDIARWGLGEVAWPKSVVSTGGKYVYTDDQETPNTQFASFDYGDKELQFEVRGIFTGGESNIVKGGGNYVGNLFLGADGWMKIDGEGFKALRATGQTHHGVKKDSGADLRPHGELPAACRSTCRTSMRRRHRRRERRPMPRQRQLCVAQAFRGRGEGRHRQRREKRQYLTRPKGTGPLCHLNPPSSPLP
jgi:predicted dehydrogenase